MPVPYPDEARRHALNRVLPVGGVLVFSPVALAVFDRWMPVGGVPLLVVYIFGAWVVGILLTAWLAIPEARAEPDDGASAGLRPGGIASPAPSGGWGSAAPGADAAGPDGGPARPADDAGAAAAAPAGAPAAGG